MADIRQERLDSRFWGTDRSSPDAGFMPSTEYQRKQDNIVLVDGEAFYGFLVTECEGFPDHVSGVVEMSGQRFPVWRHLGASGAGTRAYFGKPWHLGQWSPQLKVRYLVDATMSIKYGGKKEKSAIAYLQEKGLILSEVWQDVRRAHIGYVCLTHEEYCQVMKLDKGLYLAES